MDIAVDLPPKMAFLFRPARWKVAYGGRDSGKSWSFSRALLVKAMERSIRVLCGRELQNSIKDSVHRLLCDQIQALNMGAYFTVFDTEIRGSRPQNKDTIVGFKGIRHNAGELKSFEGADICWVEEAKDVSKSSWDVLEPTIRKPGSEIWVTFNPELDTDETYKRFVLTPPSDSIVVKMTWRDNPWPSAVLAQGRDDMRRDRPDDYAWIWEGNCRRNLEGAVYAEELRACEDEGRITQVPYDPKYPVDTFFDLGWADYTSIWFAQSTPMAIRVLDFYQNHLKKVPHYLQVLQSRGYVYRAHYLPHDGDNESPTGSTWKQLMQDAGMAVEVTERVANKRQGIDAARQVFPKCYFDAAKCADGLQSLRHFRFARDENTGHLSKLPVHDIYSHGADAFQTLGQAIVGPTQKPQKLVYPNLGNTVPRQGVMGMHARGGYARR